MRRRIYQLKIWMAQTAVVLAIVGLWLYVTGPGGVSPLLIAPPGDTLQELWQLIWSPGTWSDVATTGSEIVAAVLIAVSSGFVIGFLGSRTAFRLEVWEPLVALGYTIPFVVFYPLLLLWLGIDEASKIAFGALNGFFAMALNTMKGFKSVDQKLVRTAYAFGATPRQIEWAIKLPAAMPIVLSGVRIATALALITVIFAEMVGSRKGLGFQLAKTTGTLQTSLSYAYIIFILMFVGILHVIIERASSTRR